MDTGSVTITVGGLKAQWDADNDGQLETGELLDAINGWAQGELNTSEVLDLINIWATGG